MCPLTCGAMPMKLARTVASSVCGRVSHWSSVTATAMTAPPTIPAAISRPRRRRPSGTEGTRSSIMSLHPEERHPQNKGDEDDKAWVDQRARAQIGIDPGADEEQPREQRGHDPDQEAQHPRGEKRPDDVDLGPHFVPLLFHRTRSLRSVARREGQPGRGIQEMEFRVDLDEPGAAQLATGGQPTGQGPEP